VSPDVVTSVLAPLLREMAEASVEAHADAALMAAAREDEGNAGGEAEVGPDGQPRIVEAADDGSAPPPPRSLFTSKEDVDELETLLTETAARFKSPSNRWKVQANAAKFERLLDERYGRLRPFVESNPQVEAAFRGLQRRYAMGHFSPFEPKAPISATTAIMVLFMMKRQGVRLDALGLFAAFALFGLRPWALVALVAIAKLEADRRSRRRPRGMPKRAVVCESYYAKAVGDAETEDEERTRKYELLKKPVGTPHNPADLTLRDETFDVIILGSGTGTLYAAALLSRTGRKVCVLSPQADASGCVELALQNESPLTRSGRYDSVPFDVYSNNVARVSRQQALLVPALVTSTDAQGGIRFARIGSESDGYAHALLSVPGLGSSSASSSGSCLEPVVVGAGGPMALAEYCAARLGDGSPSSGTLLGQEGGNNSDDSGSSASLSYLRAALQINEGAGEYFQSKLLGNPDSSNSSSGQAYRRAAAVPASSFLDRCLPFTPHVRSLMAALGMAGENSAPDGTSMAAHVSHLCAMIDVEGMAYPVGGPRALCSALTSVVEQCGGRVVTGVTLQELLFQEGGDGGQEKKTDNKGDNKEGPKGGASSGPKPRCVGVRLQNGCEVTTPTDGTGAVVSALGLIPTFLNLLPTAVRDEHGVPPGLPALSERRPHHKFLIGLRGTKDDLSVTGADWYRLPNASLPVDEVDGATGQVKLGTIGGGERSSESDAAASDGQQSATEGEMTAETTTASTAGGGRGKRSKAPLPKAEGKGSRCKFHSGESWMKVSFPSAKDPSWADRHGDVTTCVVTVEADDDFVRAFDTKPKIYSVLDKAASVDAERFRERVMKDLFENFPQLEGRVETVQMSGPFRPGSRQDPARFAIKGNRPETTYPGLFVGGSELTIADSFSGDVVAGWLVANAVVGYSLIDHVYLHKNITSDLRQFLDEPSEATERDGVEVEDVAVPLVEAAESTSAAESSKEE